MIPTTGGIGSTPACHGLRAPKPDGACILLAEDDAPFRKLLSSVLEGDGHRVVQAADGAELLERLAETATRAGCKPRRLDLVITDLRMPGMSGIEGGPNMPTALIRNCDSTSLPSSKRTRQRAVRSSQVAETAPTPRRRWGSRP